MDEPSFRVETYRDEDNVFDLTADNFTVRVCAAGQLVVTVRCVTLPSGALDIVVEDERNPPGPRGPGAPMKGQHEPAH